MRTDHSPEPWRVGTARPGTIVSGGKGAGYVVAESVHHDDIRRILACMQACAGIPTDALEELKGDAEANARFAALLMKDDDEPGGLGDA